MTLIKRSIFVAWALILLNLPITTTAQLKTKIDLQIGPKWEINPLSPESDYLASDRIVNPFIIGGIISQELPLNLEVFSGLTGYTYWEVYRYQDEFALVGSSGPEVWSIPLGIRYRIKIPGVNLEINPLLSTNFRLASHGTGASTNIYIEGSDTTTITHQSTGAPDADFTVALEPGLQINYTFKNGIRIGLQSSIAIGLSQFTEGEITATLPNGTTETFTADTKGTLIKAQFSIGYEISRLWNPG